MLTQGVRALFLTQTSITDLAPAQTIGGVSFPGVFCDNAAQGMLPPYVVIASDELNPVETLDTIKSETLSIDAVAWSLENARALSNAIRAYFDAFTGVVTAATFSEIIGGVFWQNQNYSYDFPQDGGDKKYHKVTTNYLVYYS